jgi:hypothetical protein
MRQTRPFRLAALAAALGWASLGTALSAYDAGAQVSLVAATHPVYDWLQRQRVAGRAPDFSYEMLPLSRGTIVSLLDGIARHGDELAAADRSLLASFAREFSADSLAAQKSNTYLQGWDSTFLASVRKKVKLFLSDREPHLYVFTDSESNAAVDFRWDVGSYSSKTGNTSVTEKFGWFAGHAYGTLYKTLGFDVFGINAYATGSGAYIHAVPRWQAALTSDSVTGNSVLYSQGYGSWRWRALGVDLGNGAPRIGMGGNDAVILGSQTPNYPWVRLTYNGKHVQFMELYGSLLGTAVDTTLTGANGSSIPSKTYADRWLVLHRLQLRPTDFLQFDFTESVTYSHRAFDLVFLNPVYPLFTAKANPYNDSDLIWYLDGLIRPMRGVELYATLGIDDLKSLSDIWTPTGHRSNNDLTTKLMYQAGAKAALHHGTDLQAEYLRIEPFFYTHYLPLNTYQQNGYALGNELGPNADQLWFAVRQWFPGRSWLRATFAYARHGLNVVDSTGKVVQDVGGSLTSLPGPTQKILFLSGDLERVQTLMLEAHFEPSRSVGLNVQYLESRTILGKQIPNQRVLRVEGSFAFYPLSFLFSLVGLGP